MGKLQPNFSWQKFEGKEEDQKEQFQYQLQQQHILVANSVNNTIDDVSFWTKERPTAFTWVTGQQLYTQTFATVSWTSGGTVNTIPLGLVPGKKMVIQIVGLNCVLSNGTTVSSVSIPVPYIDVTTAANSVQIQRNGQNIILMSGGTDYSAYTGYVTISYIKS